MTRLTTINFRCDGCGAYFGWSHDTPKTLADFRERGWRSDAQPDEHTRHYCPDCVARGEEVDAQPNEQ